MRNNELQLHDASESEARATAARLRNEAKHADFTTACDLHERADQLEESVGVNDVRDWMDVISDSDYSVDDDQTLEESESHRS